MLTDEAMDATAFVETCDGRDAVPPIWVRSLFVGFRGSGHTDGASMLFISILDHYLSTNFGFGGIATAGMPSLLYECAVFLLALEGADTPMARPCCLSAFRPLSLDEFRLWWNCDGRDAVPPI